MIPFNFSEIMRRRQGLNPAEPPDAAAIKRPPVALPEAPARTVPLAPPAARPPQGGAQRPSYDQGAQIRDYRNNRVTNEVDFARDQYVRKGERRVANPSFDESRPESPDNLRTVGTGKYDRNWKTILSNALLGAGMGAAGGGGLGGALGGAAAAGIGSAVNPMAGREFFFNRAQAPGMYDQMEREREQRQADQAEAYRAAQIGELDARSQDRRIDNERMDAEMDRRGREFQARMQAADLDRQIREQELNRRREDDKYIRTDAGLYDTTTRQIIPGTAKRPGEDMPFASSELGIYDKRSGQVTTPANKAKNIPNEAYSQASEVQSLKTTAETAWANAKQLPPGPERNAAEATARQAQREYNNAVSAFGDLFGEYFETGQGKDNWSYIKRRGNGGGGGRQSSPNTSVEPRNVNDLLRFLKIRPSNPGTSTIF